MRPNPANRLGLDYADQARHFARHPYPIIDAHAHIVGRQAAQVYQRAAQLYGIGLTYSMTPRPHIDAVRSVLGDSVRFIAVPDFSQFETLGSRLPSALGPDYARMIEELHSQGVRLVKFWSAPRRVDLEARAGVPDALRLTAPHILEAMSTAHRLGMVIMVHIGDPDTWFATKYADTQKYGSKRQQYEDLEEVLERFGTPFIAAHMGGWPENLPFLSDLLSRYPHLHLDTSATKWMVREFSKHPRPTLLAFFRRWTGRVLFGSDIVTSDSHLSADDEASPPPSSQAEAFDLYASRYWALRTLLETDTQTPSPIADPDLAMIDPHNFGPDDAPTLIGKNLPEEVLQNLQHDTAHALLEKLHV